MQPAEVNDCSCYWQRAVCKVLYLLQSAHPRQLAMSIAAVNLTIVTFD